MNNIKIGLLILNFFFFVRSGNSQHIGAATDNYVTTQKVIYNPASIADPKPFSDTRIVGISQLLQNNYIYFPNANFTNDPLDNYDPSKKYNVYSETDVYGPAFTRVIKHRAFSINIRVRNHVIARRIPANIAKFAFEGLNYESLHNDVFDEKRFMIKNMAWGELGLSYAQIVQRKGNSILTAGATLKILNGISNISFIGKNLKYSVDSNDLDALTYKGTLDLTVPGANKGWGTGVDIGVEYKRMFKDNNAHHVPHHKQGQCQIKDYKYKIGLSMIDLGFINFNETTTNYIFKGDSIFLNDYEKNPPSGISDIERKVDEAIVATGANVKKEDKSFSTLPLTFILQGDYNFENNLYLNAQLLISVQQYNFAGAERMSTFTLTPRYELKKLTVALPISIYRYGKPGIGIYTRFWWFSFGMNNFIPLLAKKDLYNVDVYASVNIPIFHSRPCKAYETHKGDFCPKPKLKIFSFGKKKKSTRNLKKKRERKRIKKVRRIKR